jgi:hypothetical protein
VQGTEDPAIVMGPGYPIAAGASANFGFSTRTGPDRQPTQFTASYSKIWGVGCSIGIDKYGHPDIFDVEVDAVIGWGGGASLMKDISRMPGWPK